MQALPCVLSEGEHPASIADSSLGFEVKWSKSSMSVFHAEPPFPKDIWTLPTLFVGICLSLVATPGVVWSVTSREGPTCFQTPVVPGGWLVLFVFPKQAVTEGLKLGIKCDVREVLSQWVDLHVRPRHSRLALHHERRCGSELGWVPQAPAWSCGFKDRCNSRLRFRAIRWVFPSQVSSEVCSGFCPPYMLCVSCSLDGLMLAGWPLFLFESSLIFKCPAHDYSKSWLPCSSENQSATGK